MSQDQKRLRVIVTGAAGQVGSHLLFGIAHGQLLGADTFVDLVLYDIPAVRTKLEGNAMELDDCAFPLLKTVTIADSLQEAFSDVDVVILAGARPRGPGMERRNLLELNATIFREQGQAIEKYAKKTVKVCCIGNPANTMALVAWSQCPSIPSTNFAALSRLDHNRALSKIRSMLPEDKQDYDISNISIFGNHSASMAVVTSSAVIVKGSDSKHLSEVFSTIPKAEETLTQFTRKRGAEIIAKKGTSSAASAARAALTAVYDWINGNENGTVSMAVVSDGKAYDVPKGIFCSLPLCMS
ncbi:hypothetical protein GEMRC1_009340 [Eukaryota sp. GEM-RC1]